MPLSEEFINKWDHIISEVEKTLVPLDCLTKMIIRLDGGRRKTINISRLRKDGLDSEEIESVLSRNLIAFDTQIKDVDFILDIKAVADIVQPQTDEFLNKL